jgi:hypothetical protein
MICRERFLYSNDFSHNFKINNLFLFYPRFFLIPTPTMLSFLSALDYLFLNLGLATFFVFKLL